MTEFEIGFGGPSEAQLAALKTLETLTIVLICIGVLASLYFVLSFIKKRQFLFAASVMLAAGFEGVVCSIFQPSDITAFSIITCSMQTISIAFSLKDIPDNKRRIVMFEYVLFILTAVIYIVYNMYISHIPVSTTTFP